MPKATYKALGQDDPKDTSMGGVEFIGGKSVEVSDEMAKKLETNPWFSVTGQKQAKQNETNAGTDGEPVSLANNPNYPPGVGSKSTPPSVMVSTGETLPPQEGTDRQDEINAEAQKRGPGRPAKS